MATITLPGFTFDCVMGMGAFEGIGTAFSNVKKSTSSLSGTLGTLKSKINLASVVAAVDTSQDQTKKAEEREMAKKSSLSLAYEKLNDLISDVGSVDIKASGKIRERKEAFYDRYYYLKPECEKNRREKAKEAICNGIDSIGKWAVNLAESLANHFIEACKWLKENLDNILKVVTAVLVVVALAVLTVLTAGTCWGIIFGMAAVGASVGMVMGAAKGVNAYNSGESQCDSMFESIANNMLKGTIEGGASGAADGIAAVVPGGVLVRIGTRFFAGEVLQVGANAWTGKYIEGKTNDEAWGDAIVSGTISNITDTVLFSFSDLKYGIKLPKNQILQYASKNQMQRDLTRDVINEAMKQELILSIPKIIFSTFFGVDGASDVSEKILSGHEVY